MAKASILFTSLINILNGVTQVAQKVINQHLELHLMLTFVLFFILWRRCNAEVVTNILCNHRDNWSISWCNQTHIWATKLIHEISNWWKWILSHGCSGILHIHVWGRFPMTMQSIDYFVPLVWQQSELNCPGMWWNLVHASDDFAIVWILDLIFWYVLMYSQSPLTIQPILWEKTQRSVGWNIECTVNELFIPIQCIFRKYW